MPCERHFRNAAATEARKMMMSMMKWVAIFLVITAVAYTGFFLSLTSAPFTDAPNHLARAAIMKSLWLDPHSPFHGMFSARHFFMPYILPDLGVILTIRIFGFDLACPIWSTLTMLALVLSVWFYARQVLTTPWGLAAAMLCSWYIATNYLFILGFFSFQWGVAAAFVVLGSLKAWRRDKSTAWFALYVFACFVCYGSHMAAFAIVAAIVGCVGLARVIRKDQSRLRLAVELLPFAAFTIYHLLLVPAHPESLGGKLTHNTVGDKFGHFLESMFVRQNYVAERSVLILFWGIIVAAMWFGIRRAGLGRHWELAAICGLATTIYFVLPFGLGGIYYVDERALLFFFIPLLMLTLRLFEDASPAAGQVMSLMVACCVLATANLGALASFLPRQNHELALYREALQTIPARKTVLPIHTRRRDGNTYPLRHAGSFYAADRDGYVPYFFSQENASGPAGYFTDLSPIYRPAQSWYMGKGEPDWSKVARTYDYVVITKPWNPRRIDRARLELYFENEVATIFRVRR
jgi:hypothetical protein